MLGRGAEPGVSEKAVPRWQLLAQNLEAHPPMVTDQAALLCLCSFGGQLDIFNLGGVVKEKLGYPMQKLLSRKPR